MGTKNKPGRYDCYEKAGPDEPMFTLLGRDPMAPLLVRLWTVLRARIGTEAEKLEEALSCADDMEAMGKTLPPEVREVLERVLLTATEGLASHPDGYTEACSCDECKAA